MSRSTSFQEDLNQSMQRSAKSNPALKELAISENINDQLLSLVHTIAVDLRSRSFSKNCPKPAFKPNITRTSNTQECLPSPEPVEAKQAEPEVSMQLPQILEDGLTKWCRSCVWLPEKNETLSPFMESFDGANEDKWNHNNVGRARSFHTVEEYDALIENIRLSGAEIVSDGEDSYSTIKVQLNHSQSSTYASQHDGDSYGTKEIQKSEFKDETSQDKNSMIEEISTLSSSELESEKHNTNPSRSRTTKELNVVGNCPPEQHILQKGFKRKSIAKRLKSLEIPETIEFPAVASLREGLHVGGQVYSPGAYVTPKFGSYSLPSNETANKCDEGVIFNPELVAACEECMQQLEAEAETILRQIAENMHGERKCNGEASQG